MARDDSPELVAELDRLDETAKAIPAGDTTAQIALRRRAASPEHRFFLARDADEGAAR
ncbi:MULTISPECIES: hypothetical protein [Amycolatopsis]|uniref:hypothetical protein n=1 Tax=Amycolatopsis TaxID=1813 RepID=UPI001C576296|nr:hypothetical protein [Amycolatopsis sp. TNS106]